MRIQSLHKDFTMPTKGTTGAGAYDLYMPEAGSIPYNGTITVGLGFAAEVPAGNIALLLPRSSAGAKFGIELNNSAGVIDSDYRGEWKAVLRTKNNSSYAWLKGDRLLQFVIVPITAVTLEQVTDLSITKRGSSGFGSSGK